ncbi:MAG: hypothetical protein HGA44_10425 [Cellulomonadaceae bacterium]|nr:hypothetical protein [Cellulomonadaceae bacterium]
MRQQAAQRRRRAVGLMAAALAVAAGTTGCSGTPDPEGFAERPALASCGEITLDQGQGVPDDSWACLDAAAADGSGAELTVSMPTVEGDQIVTYYRVGRGIDGLEVYVDASADRFAGPDARGWVHQLCPGTVKVAEPLGCRDA